MTSELRPCAHCGSKVKLFECPDVWPAVGIMCTGCFVGVPIQALELKDKVIEAWNRRHD